MLLLFILPFYFTQSVMGLLIFLKISLCPFGGHMTKNNRLHLFRSSPDGNLRMFCTGYKTEGDFFHVENLVRKEPWDFALYSDVVYRKYTSYTESHWNNYSLTSTF